MNITFTAEARKFMGRMVRLGGAGPDAGFRLTVTPGGCSGYSSEFSVEPHARPGDAALDVDGLKIFLPAQSRVMLEGFTVGFADTPMETGLTFVNPAAGSCGTCGTSKPAATTIELAAISRRS